MGKDNLSHEHSVSNEWLGEQAVNNAVGSSSANTNFHQDNVSDSAGKTGHGSGRSSGEATHNAISDYFSKK